MRTLKFWVRAVRPKTLTLAAVPVGVGSAFAWVHLGSLNWVVVGATLVAATFIQVGTNLHNDFADFTRGADDRERLGPPRATAEGWLTPAQVRGGAAASFAVAVAVGVYLIWVGGWPIFLVGLASIIAGWAYTGGPYPLGYLGLGELFVFLFFGLIAVAGSYYLQTGTLEPSIWVAGAGLGMPAAAVLVVNNYRDLEGDRRAGKRTLAVRLGRSFTRHEYTLLVLAPFVLLPMLLPIPWNGVLLLLLPWAAYLVYRFHTEAPSPRLNSLLAGTAQFQLALGLVFSMGLVLAGK